MKISIVEYLITGVVPYLITPAYAVTLVPVMYEIQEEACVDLPLDSYKVMPNIS